MDVSVGRYWNFRGCREFPTPSGNVWSGRWKFPVRAEISNVGQNFRPGRIFLTRAMEISGRIENF
jgi:hypothetical protein